jgi:uncharacterized protein YodC (DUF2158 family)
MNNAEYKVGDVVQLKSGGPHMTITSVGGHYCECTWFDKHTNQQRRAFPPFALSHIAKERPRVAGFADCTRPAMVTDLSER